MKKLKFLLLFISGLFGSVSAKIMDNKTAHTLKGIAFDSYEEDEYDDEFDDSFDDADNVTGTDKRNPMRQKATQGRGGAQWRPTTGYFTLQIVNGINAITKVELFNSLNNWASVLGVIQPTFNPFTFTNRAAANANSTIVWAANGDLTVTSAAGTVLTISCEDIPYKTLIETLKFYRVHVAETKMTFVNETQLNQKIQYTMQTFLGKSVNNQWSPRKYFKDGQFQTKQVTMPMSYIIDGETGLNFNVGIGETISVVFTLDRYAKVN